MLIGIDASRATAAQRTGTETYSLHLIRELLALGKGHRFRLYFNQPPAPGLFPDAAEMRVMPFARLWTHARLSREMRTAAPDLLFVPSHVLPLLHPERCVVTIHDLGFYYYPEAHTLSQNLYLRWSTRYNARIATRVIADSIATRNDLLRYYRVPGERIEVVYPGRDEALGPVRDPEVLQDVRARYGLSEPYLLYVGTLHPRKNLVRLVQAFSAFTKAMAAGPAKPKAEPQLVLAGQKGWLYEEILNQVRKLDLVDRVVFTGYVPDADLPAVLSGAVAFVFPSLYEGFGLPVLEAMACGTPVICSNVSSLPEVAGEAALQVDPLDVEALAEAIHWVISDAGLRATLVERGYEQVQRFSWQRCASQVLQVLEDAGRGLG
ncbi:MAG: glycosyltransferase family 4 protein [Anaerolineae bacterium]|jgi:glycosyltransferase involved in cell wall biosynthesis